MIIIRKLRLATLVFMGALSFRGVAATNSPAVKAPVAKAQPRQIMRSGMNQFTGMVEAVVVDDGPLVHTAQVLPWGRQGEIVGKGDVSRQTGQVLENLLLALNAGGAQQNGIVKINVYVARTDMVPAVREAMMRRSRQFGQAAMSFVTGNLMDPDALVAMDAIAITDREDSAVTRLRAPGLAGMKDTAAAILPGGGKYYVSGQAKNGALPEAARDTLASLEATLTFLGLGKSNVAQLKAFMQPISDAGAVQGEIVKFFAPNPPPPTVFVEGSSPTNTPIEIEMIAADNKPAVTNGETVNFLTPPGLAVSKVFSRVAQVTHGRMIYFSELYGNEPGPAGIQFNDIYVYLDYLLPRIGTDFDHLVKATYYVTDEDASSKLNDIRPKFYSPERPPAASKAMVKGVGFIGRSAAVDMIGVAR